MELLILQQVDSSYLHLRCMTLKEVCGSHFSSLTADCHDLSHIHNTYVILCTLTTCLSHACSQTCTPLIIYLQLKCKKLLLHYVDNGEEVQWLDHEESEVVANEQTTPNRVQLAQSAQATDAGYVTLTDLSNLKTVTGTVCARWLPCEVSIFIIIRVECR